MLSVVNRLIKSAKAYRPHMAVRKKRYWPTRAGANSCSLSLPDRLHRHMAGTGRSLAVGGHRFLGESYPLDSMRLFAYEGINRASCISCCPRWRGTLPSGPGGDNPQCGLEWALPLFPCWEQHLLGRYVS